MNDRLLVAVFLGLVGGPVSAAAPPPEQVLPPDTLVVLAVPEYARTKTAVSNAPMGQLWRDPAVEPFPEKLSAKLKQEVIGPLEDELRLRLPQVLLDLDPFTVEVLVARPRRP